MDILAFTPNQNDLFTSESLGTLLGITSLTMVIANGMQRAFNWNPKWLALAIAEFLCIAIVYNAEGGVSDYLIGFANGFLVYCTASGGTNTGGAIVSGVGPAIHRQSADRSGGPAVQGAKRTRRGFFSPWPL